jgi:hypothetical protein
MFPQQSPEINPLEMNFDSALKRSDCKLHGGISLTVWGRETRQGF